MGENGFPISFVSIQCCSFTLFGVAHASEGKVFIWGFDLEHRPLPKNTFVIMQLNLIICT